MADVAVVALRAGETYGGADVTVELTDGDGTAVVGYADGAIVAPFTVQAHGLTGAATLHLIPNASISPANTYYTVTVGDFSMLIEVGAGGGALEDLLVTDPAALAPTLLTAHLADTTDAHDASAVSFVPNGTIAATNVQAAIQEVRDEASALAEPVALAHIADTVDAHAGTAITNTPAGSIAATTVQAAINELDSEKASTGSVSTVASDLSNHLTDTGDAHDASAISTVAAGNLAATDVQAALNELDTEKLAGTTAATTYQPLDTDLTAIAALTSAADKVPYSTGAGTWALTDFSAAGRALVDDADASAQRTTLGLVIGTNVQAQDAELSAIAGLTSAADALPYFTGAGTAAVTTLTAAARTVLDDTTVGAMLATMGGVAISGTSSGAQVVLQAGNATHVPLRVQGATAQSANLQQWQNSVGAAVATIRATGKASLLAGIYTEYLEDSTEVGPYFWMTSGSIIVKNRTTATNVPLTVKGMAAQSGDLQQWQNSSGTVLASVSSAGLGSFAGVTLPGSTDRLKFGHADQAQTTVGAAGGASALPATPTKYFKVKDSGGTEYVIPAYAAA